MSYYNTCPRCGAHLDPGESCEDCRVMDDYKKREPFAMELLDKPPYRGIYDRLRPGKENAVPVLKLRAALGLDDRAVRKAVERMRRSGLPICSCQQGYFMPRTRDELYEYVESVNRTIRSECIILHTAKKALRAMDYSTEKSPLKEGAD